MADNRYIIDIILDTKLASANAFQKVSKDLQALQRLNDQVTASIDRQAEARERLDEVTTDQQERARRVNEEYSDQEAITRKNATAQLILANATERYAEVERKADENTVRGRARRALAERQLTAARNQLTESIVEGKKQEILADIANQKSIQTISAKIEAQEKEVETLKQLKQSSKEWTEEDKKSLDQAEKRLESLEQSGKNLFEKLYETRRRRIVEAVSAEVEALEELSLESARQTRQNKELSNSLSARLKIQEDSVRAVEREAAALKKSGFADKERIKRIEELGAAFEDAYDKSTDGANKFEEAKQKALTIDKADADAVSAAFTRIQRSLDTARQQKARAFAAAGRDDETVRIAAELEAEKAAREAEAARAFLQSIIGTVEANLDLDPSGLISKLPEIEAIKAFLARDVNFQVEAEIDNASLARTITLKEGFKGLGAAIGAGLDDAGKGISNFDNLVRGLVTLNIALFFQQILIAAVGLAAALSALVSSAIAAGAALGGALASGALQALPAIGVLAAFANRVTNVLGAVKQANLLQQQEASKSGQAANQQARSLDAVIAAQERVKEAQDGITEARKKAREALEDLILQEQRQNLTLEAAQERLQKAVSSGGSFAVAQAQLDVQEAGNNLGRTRGNLAERTRQGISGSPEVTDAQKRLRDAQRALVQARQSAEQAGQSVSAASGKLDFLLANLSNAERRLYQAIIRLQKTWQGFAKTISEPLINSFTTAVDRVTTILRSSGIVALGRDIGNALSSSFRQAFNFLLSDETIGRVANLGREFVRNLQPLTNIAINLASAFLDIAELGAPALATIIRYIEQLTDSFAEFTSSVKGRTLISEFFEAGTGSLIRFSELLRALGRVIFAVIGRPGSGLGLDAGNKLLDIFIDGLNNLADAINNPDSKIRNFFERFFKYSDDIVLAFGPIIASLAGVIDNIFTEDGINNVKGFSDFIATVLIPAIAQAATAIAFLTTQFVELTKTFPVLKELATGFIAALIGGGILLRVTALAKPIRSIFQYAFSGAGTNSIFKIMAQDADKATGRIRKFGDALVASSTMPDKNGNFSSFLSRRFGSGIRDRLGAIDDAAEAGTRGTALIDPDTGRFTTREEALKKTRKGGIRGFGQKVVQKTPVLGKIAMGAGFAGGPAALAASGGAGSAAGFLGGILGPAGIILAVVAAVTALLAISGKLDDVWRAIKDTVSGVLQSIKEALGELAKEITGEASVKDAFKEIYEAVKAVGSFLASILIPAFKILGTSIGTVVVTIIKRITAIVRFVKNAFSGIKQFWEGIFDLDFGKAAGGLGKVLGAIAQLIFDFLKAPFEALASVTGNVFKNIGNKIEQIFVGVVNAIIKGVNKVIAAINKVNFISGDIEEVALIGNENRNGQSRQAKTTSTRGIRGSSSGSRAGSFNQKTKRGDSGFKGDGKSKASKGATKADNENAENFLSSFNPETVKLSDEITKKLSTYWRTLRREARTAANYVTARLGDIRKDGGKDVDKFVDAASADFQRLRRSVRNNMIGVANIVTNQMQNASMAVYKGAQYMKDTLNDALKSVGADQVDLTIKVPKIREQKAQGGYVGRAGGGWIGNRGERGRDAVPTMLGRGEAVLNWQQQKLVEPALYKTYGIGLDDIFNRTNGYHAGGPNTASGLARGGRPFRSGRASWFGGPNDGMNVGTAIGVPDTTPGIALYNQATLRKWFDVVSPRGRKARLKQIDFGPAPWTGKILDITSAALKYFGFNEGNFPTGVGTWNVYGPYNGRGSNKNSATGGTPAEIAMPKIKGGSKAMRDIVSKGLDKFRKAANKKIERETPEEVTASGGVAVPRGAAGKIRQGIALARRLGLNISSFNEGYSGDGVHTPSSFHYQSRAIDVTGSAAQMAAFFRAALKRFGKNIVELFYDPLGAIKYGQSIAPVGGHSDHVHLALARGGRASMSKAYERRRVELAKREKKAAQKMRGLRKYAQGGSIEGAEGQAVPIMAHAGEWVLNKRQQKMVAGIAGTTADRLKGMLGFSGGPTSFAGGGDVRGFTRNPLAIPPGLLQPFASFGTFDNELTKAIKFITKAVGDVLTDKKLRREIKEAEKRLAKLKSGDGAKKDIEDTEDLIKNLKGRRDYTTLLKSIRQLTGTEGDGGALSEYANKIKKQFDDATALAKLASAGFQRVGASLKRIVDPKQLADALNPAKLAELEAKAQEGLVTRLIDLRDKYQVTLTNLEKASKRLPSSARLASEVRKIDKTIEKLEKRDNKGDKDRIKKLEERKKAIEANQKIRQQIDGELNTLRDKLLEKENEIVEAEQARLEAEQKAFEERTKQATRTVDQGDIFNNFLKSLGELTGNSQYVTGALQSASDNAKERLKILEKRLAEATEKAQSDPRWQSVVDDLTQQVLDANLAVAQTQADIIQNSLEAIDNAFQRSETTRGLSDRVAALADKAVAGSGNATRLANLQGKGTDLGTQRDAIAKLLENPNINAKQAQELRDRLAELEVAIRENTQEVADLKLQIRQQAIESITGISSRTGGLFGSAGSIFDNIGKALGQPTTQSQLSLAQALKTALGLENTNLAREIGDFIAGPDARGLIGPEGTSILNQLLAAFSSGDPSSFAAVLQALAPQIALLESTLGDTARSTFSAFIDSMVNNTVAVTENTANLNELNGLANQPQPFSTTAWTRFRQAIFNGIGDVLPQYDIPQMATGGYITKGGMFELHPGEFVVKADGSNVDQGDINITVNEANKPLDVTALASRIAFEKRNRR